MITRARIVSGLALVALTSANYVAAPRVRQVVDTFAARQKLHALEKLVADARLIEPRWSSAARHVPLQRNRSTAPSGALRPESKVLIAELDALSATSDVSEVLAAAGSADLLELRAAEGVALLERSLRAVDTDPELFITLSAAYLVRDHAGDVARGFDSARRALRRSPGAPAALFNEALATQRLFPETTAADAWRRFVAAETDQAWRNEGEERSRSRADTFAVPSGANASVPFSSEKGAQFLAARAHLFDKLLTQWARTCIAERTGDPLAALSGSIVDVVAEITKQSADRYPADVAAWLTAGPTATRCDPRRAAAYLQLDAGRRLYNEDRQAEALPIFESLAKSALRESPMESEALIFAAPLQYLAGKHFEALEACGRVAALSQKRRYLAILGRAEYIRGWAAHDQSRFQMAFDAYSAALRHYEAASDLEGAAGTQTVMASLLDGVGEYEAAWQRREVALLAATMVKPSRATYSIFSEAAKAALRDGLYEVGVAFAQHAIDEASLDRSANRVAEASLDRAANAIRIGPAAGADRDLAVARAQLPRAASVADTTRLQAKLALVEASVNTEPGHVIPRVTEAIDSYAATGSDIVQAKLHLARGRAYLLRHDEVAAARDFETGIVSFERARASLRDPSRRISYFDEAWELFDEAVALLVKQHRFDEALHVVERQRGRVLRERITAMQDAQGPSMRPPDGAAIIYYVLLPTSVVVWVIDSHGNRPVVIARTRSEVEHLAHAFTHVVRSNGLTAQQQAAGAALYEVLISPLRALLGANRRLFIVADPLLQNIPFAALWHEASGRYLVEDFEIAMLPGLAVVTTDTASQVTSNTPAVFVAAATGGSSFGLRLPNLPRVIEETRQVSDMYVHARLLNGDYADAAALLRELAGRRIFHFAGHSIVNPDAPHLSRLVLSGNSSSQSIYAYEFEQLDLRHLDLVVLSACDTATGRSHRSEGVVSLARSFLQAGVPAVVSTLWTIDDDVALRLFTDFHRQLLRGANTPRALASAQRAMINDSNGIVRSPTNWAAVIDVTRLVN
jgi:CHAT domain-containing protein